MGRIETARKLIKLVPNIFEEEREAVLQFLPEANGKKGEEKKRTELRKTFEYIFEDMDLHFPESDGSEPEDKTREKVLHLATTVYELIKAFLSSPPEMMVLIDHYEDSRRKDEQYRSHQAKGQLDADQIADQSGAIAESDEEREQRFQRRCARVERDHKLLNSASLGTAPKQDEFRRALRAWASMLTSDPIEQEQLAEILHSDGLPNYRAMKKKLLEEHGLIVDPKILARTLAALEKQEQHQATKAVVDLVMTRDAQVRRSICWQDGHLRPRAVQEVLLSRGVDALYSTVNHVITIINFVMELIGTADQELKKSLQFADGSFSSRAIRIELDRRYKIKADRGMISYVLETWQNNSY